MPPKRLNERLKFSCPSCGQHLSVDSSMSGSAVTCPACGRQVTVPGAVAPNPPPLSVRTTPTISSPPPPPGPGVRSAGGPGPMRPPGGRPTRTSGLAIASIICSIGSFCVIPFGFIPGIICGHMAKKKIALDRSLTGEGLAKAGLIIGYVSAGLTLVTVIVMLAFLPYFTTQFRRAVEQQQQQQQQPQRGSWRGPVSGRNFPPTSPNNQPFQKDSTKPNSTGNESANDPPDGSGWTLQLADATVPDATVSGRMRGKTFTAEKAVFEHGWLKFRRGAGFFADLQMDVVPFVSTAQQLSGRKFEVQPKNGASMHPHIWMHWTSEQADSSSPKPDQKAWTTGYAMKLEFGQISNGKLPGKIYLCLPDAEKSFIRGTFEAEIAK